MLDDLLAEWARDVDARARQASLPSGQKFVCWLRESRRGGSSLPAFSSQQSLSQISVSPTTRDADKWDSVPGFRRT